MTTLLTVDVRWQRVHVWLSKLAIVQDAADHRKEIAFVLGVLMVMSSEFVCRDGNCFVFFPFGFHVMDPRRNRLLLL